MADNFTSFFKENTIAPEAVEYIASERFKDAEGKPLPWKIRPITSEEFGDIQKAATRTRIVKGKPDVKVDMGEFCAEWCARAVVHPNLKDKKLQDNWGAVGETDLLTRMLPIAGEIQDLYAKAREIAGFDRDIGEAIDEAKN